MKAPIKTHDWGTFEEDFRKRAIASGKGYSYTEEIHIPDDPEFESIRNITKNMAIKLSESLDG